MTMKDAPEDIGFEFQGLAKAGDIFIEVQRKHGTPILCLNAGGHINVRIYFASDEELRGVADVLEHALITEYDPLSLLKNPLEEDDA